MLDGDETSESFLSEKSAPLQRAHGPKNIAATLGHELFGSKVGDPWDTLLARAAAQRGEHSSEVEPYWVYNHAARQNRAVRAGTPLQP